MLSILIPVYNFDVRNFVYELHKQAVSCKIDFEILVYDDCSLPEFQKTNNKISELNNLIYKILENNIGRSKIRNLLAKDSKFQNLIFVDCDSQINSENYISDYLKHADREKVVCGGRIYSEEKPEQKELYLRWFYGIKREQTSATQRNLNSNASFMTNNFLISKDIFQNLCFDEKISKYGHEDTLFGYELKKNEIRVFHIDNPLIHIGLETNTEFLKKTEQAVLNLKYITENYNATDLKNDIKLLKYTSLLRVFSFIILPFFNLLKKKIIANILSDKPNLLVFDIYKLSIFLSCKKNDFKKQDNS